MKKKLDLLQNLQAIDLLIDEKNLEKQTLLERIADWEATMASLAQAKDALVVCLEDLQAEQTGLEQAMGLEQENVKRSEHNMRDIKTNKEFQAVGREIAAARKQISDIEERLLAITQRIEDTTVELEKSQSCIEDQQLESTRATTEIQAAIDAISQNMQEMSGQRLTIVESLPQSILRRYTQLREQRRGIALSIAQDGSCLGCNMHLPPQLYNSLYKGDEMYLCPHCQRILILKAGEEVPV